MNDRYRNTAQSRERRKEVMRVTFVIGGIFDTRMLMAILDKGYSDICGTSPSVFTQGSRSTYLCLFLFSVVVLIQSLTRPSISASLLRCPQKLGTNRQFQSRPRELNPPLLVTDCLLHHGNGSNRQKRQFVQTTNKKIPDN